MFTDIQDAIVERLKAKLSDVLITTEAELERVPELRNKAPAVFVVYDGFSPADSPTPQNPGVQRIELRYTVVVTTKNARGNGTATAAQSEMDALSGQVIEALIGYALGAGRYLRLSTAPGAEYDAGYAYNPIGFTVLRTFKAAP